MRRYGGHFEAFTSCAMVWTCCLRTVSLHLKTIWAFCEFLGRLWVPHSSFTSFGYFKIELLVHAGFLTQHVSATSKIKQSVQSDHFHSIRLINNSLSRTEEDGAS